MGKFSKLKKKNFLLFFDRSFSKGFGLQIMWLFLIMLAVYLILIVMSYSGAFYDSASPESKGRWYDVLFFLIDPGIPPDHLLSPFAVVIAMVGMVIFSGMLISVISNILSLRVEKYQHGDTSYKVSDHAIILGFNRSVPSLIYKIQKRYPKSHILLLCEKDSEEIRDWIHANIDDRIESNLIVMNGDINASDDLERLSLGRNPREIYVLGEEGRENHDDISLECVKKLSAILRQEASKSKDAQGASHRIPCYVQIDSDTMFSLLQQVDFCGDPQNRTIVGLEFHPFNFNEIWAQKVLSLTSFEGVGYKPLDGTGIGRDSGKSVHLIIVGMTGLAKALALNAAQVLHFPNFKEGDFKTYSRITFIDHRADEMGQRFRNRHSVLFDLARWKADDEWHDPLADEDSESRFKYLGPANFMDVEWEFIKGDVAEPRIRKYLKESCSTPWRIVTLALCGEDSERNLAISMGLSAEVLEGSALNMVLVRQKESDLPVRLMRELPVRGEKFRAFGMLNECYSENLLNDTFGKLVNALYCGGLSIESDDPEELAKIDAAWEPCSIANKWSSNYSANMLFIKLRSLGLNPMNISKEEISKRIESPSIQEDIMRAEHNRWVTEKILMGFSPLTQDELDSLKPFSSDPQSEEAKRVRKAAKSLANTSKKHLDICSYEMLGEVDPVSIAYDDTVNAAMWSLYLKISKSTTE